MKHTPETKRKLSIMRSGKKNPFFGKHHTAATKKKLSAITRTYNLTKRTYEIIRRTVRIPTGNDLAYLAGLVDGEGTVGYRLKKYPFIAVYNGDRALWKWIKDKTGISPKWTDFRGRIPGWSWHVQSMSNVYWLCIALIPMLVIKKKKAQEVVLFLERKYGLGKLREVS